MVTNINTAWAHLLQRSLEICQSRKLSATTNRLKWLYSVAQNVISYYQIIEKKLYYIVLKPVNEIRFIRQIKVLIKHYIN